MIKGKHMHSYVMPCVKFFSVATVFALYFYLGQSGLSVFSLELQQSVYAANHDTNIGPLGSGDDLNLPTVDASQSQFQNLLNMVFMVTGALAAIFIIVGGIQYVMSIGSPDRIESAKNTILYAVIGLVVTLFAAAIVNFIVSSAL